MEKLSSRALSLGTSFCDAHSRPAAKRGGLRRACRARALTTQAIKGELGGLPIETHFPELPRRAVSTKRLPGDAWLGTFRLAGFSVDVCLDPRPILKVSDLRSLIGSRCDGLVGQLTEPWGPELFRALAAAGGAGYSNFAVGFNNIDVPAATAAGIAVGTTPGVLTQSTAELGVALTLAAARRTGEAERFMRTGRFEGFLPDMFVGKKLQGSTLGVLGSGRIGAAYALAMVRGFGMNLVYWSFHRNQALEEEVRAYARYQESRGVKDPVTVRFCDSVEGVLEEADITSIHCALSDKTRHLIDAARLARMKPDAILVNTARGPIVDEAALVQHLRDSAGFTAALDVYEGEPAVAPGLLDAENAVLLPHIGSASLWTRSNMAKIAAANVVGSVLGYPAWGSDDVMPFVDAEPADLPKASPSILNAKDLGLEITTDPAVGGV